MTLKDIKKVTVIGGGRMGRQIGLQAAIYNYDVTVYDLAQAVLDDVVAWEADYLAGRVAKGKMTEEQVAGVKARYHVEGDLKKAVEDADLIIEAIVEVEQVKHDFFKSIDPLIKPTCIVATNSSYMCSSIFAGDFKDPSRLCNMHFYNPALVLKFVEIVQGPHCSTETAQTAYDFCVDIKKMPIWQKKEIPGFAGNYIYAGLTQRAKYLVQNEYCTWRDCDVAMEEGFALKQGPFRLNDLTGINLAFDMMKGQYAKTGVKPDMYDIYEQMVKEGRFGRTTGRGFYDYTGTATDEEDPYKIPEVRPESLKNIKKVTIIGGGRMGRQIGLQAAIYNYDVTVYDLAQKVLDDVVAWEEEYLAGRLAKGKMTEEQVAGIKSRYHVEGDLAKAVGDADMVIEAIVEVEKIKHEFFQSLEPLIKPTCIVATNSSLMPSSMFAGDFKDPSRLCNMHFYNPALVLKFVEVVQGPHCSTATAQTAYDFCIDIRKMPIWQKKEIPGFAGNFLYGGISENAHFLVENGYCTWRDCDIAMEEGFAFPMGPFRLNDLTGINLSYDMMKDRYEKTGVKPDMFDIYEQMVKEGRYGRVTKHGFYDYE